MTRIRYPLTIYYDGACDLCRGQMNKIAADDTKNRLTFQDITERGFSAEDHGLDQADLHTYVYVIDREGRSARGVDAFTWVWWATGHKTLSIIFRIAGIRMIAKGIYKIISRFRYIFNHACGAKVCRGKCGWKRY